MRTSTTALLVVLLCVLCLYPSAASSAASSPFAATGLLAHRDETAEGILLRAHQRDAKAMLLVIVGYTRGLAGFPKEPLLANAWLHQLPGIGALEAFGLAATMLAQEADSSQMPPLGTRLAFCDLARQDKRMLATFKESGIFDLERVCEVLEATKNANPEWEKTYTQVRNIFQEKGRVLPAVNTARELRSRPATPKDEQVLDQLADDSLALFFVATTHSPATERPNWNNERLIAFLDAQYRTPTFSNIRALTRKIVAVFPGRISENPPHVLDNIRKAHLGDMEAVRTMARYYQEGNFGFIKNIWLANGWLAYGAYRGDSRSQVQLAALSIFLGLPEVAQPWAAIAKHAPEEDLRDEARKLEGMLNSWLDERKKGWAELTLVQIKADMSRRTEWGIMRGAQPAVTP